jgi:general secretion pathway protein L
MSESRLRSGFRFSVGESGRRFQSTLGRLGASLSGIWKKGRDVWLRDPVEIEVLTGGEGRPRARVGRSKRLVELDELRRRFRLWAPFSSVTVKIPVQDCLVRVIQLPKAAVPRASEILQVDLERTTPFRDEVLTGWHRPPQDTSGDQVSLHHVILKRDLIVPVLDDIRAAGLPIKAVVPVEANGNPLPVNLLPTAQRSSASAMVALRTVALACVAALYAFAIVAIWLTISGLGTALATSDSEVRKAADEAREITRIVTEANTMAAQLAQPRLSKIGRTPVTAIWEEVTRLLPESTWLSSFRVEDDTVQIDGNSSNASELIPLLAGSPLFRNVTFASPVTRDPQRGTERFQIRIQVARHDGVKTTQAQPVFQ